MSAAFAGGAFVRLQLQGADDVENEFKAMSDDMRKFTKLARDISKNFGVDATVDDLNRFRVSGDRSQEALKTLVKELESMEGVQRRTRIMIKDTTEENRRAAQESKRYEKRLQVKRILQKKAAKEAKEAAKKERELERAKAAAARKAAAEHQRLTRERQRREEKRRREEAQAARRLAQEKMAQERKLAREVERREKEKSIARDKANRQTIQSMNKIAQMGRRGFGLYGLAIGIRTMRTLGQTAIGLLQPLGQVADEIDRIGKTANKLGVSAQFMYDLSFAAEQTGANFEQLQAGMKAMQRNIGLFGMGAGEAKTAFEALGISIEDLQGLSAEQQMMFLSDALSGISDSATRAAIATRIFGEGGQDLANLTAGGANALVAYSNQVEALGLTMTEADANGAAKFKDSLNIAQKTIQMFAGKIVTALAPAVEELVVFMNALIQTLLEFESGGDTAERRTEAISEAVEFLKSAMFGAVAVFYELNAALRLAEMGYNIFYGSINSINKLVIQGMHMLAKAYKNTFALFGTDVDISAFDALLEDVNARIADTQARYIAAQNLYSKNKNKAAEWWRAARGEGSEVGRKTLEKVDEIKETLDIPETTAPETDITVAMDDDTKAAAKLLADFSSSTEYGIEGLKKAQKNVDEKQIALLKKIASNTANAPAIAGVP